MTTPFAFVPRAVSKYTKEWQGISRPPSSPPPPPDPTTDDDDGNDEPGHEKRKGKEKAVERPHPKQSFTQDIAYLVSLALADYNIWLDPDLRWKLDACLQDDIPPDEAAFVPISYLLRRAPFHGSLPLADGQPDPSETEVVKALRAHASDSLQVRMRLPTSSSVWYGTGKTSRKKDVGAYEVRRRAWQTLHGRPSRGWTRTRWDNLTAYLEHVPPQYRSVGGIARFVESLLWDTEADSDAGPRLHVQCVTLPPHYLDRPGDVPKCKGYALVTFSTKLDLETLLATWPWKRGSVPSNALPIVKEAYKYGLRTISKARWGVLNEEYLAYKQSLIEEVARGESDISHRERAIPDVHFGCEDPVDSPLLDTETQTRTTSSSRYPFDCLIFVRNVHPDTNKTTLKVLFTQAFKQDQDGDPHGHGSVPGLDYVDFNKGMDTCHLRLASPDHTKRIMAYFDARPTAQAHGLDTTGRSPLADDKPIAMEMVQGKKEEVYWEKIPEKVRCQAVDKVVRARLANGVGLESETAFASAPLCAPSSSSARGSGVDGSRQTKRRREH